ncbi:ubiquitin-protein ligase peroxin 10 [Martiniozyma asiatica (nom. inval.)]|nr:ubiquitin-protein ligase peroxin 10 [Martiniozyma asiatica]
MHTLPPAPAAAIVRSIQKDNAFINLLTNQIINVSQLTPYKLKPATARSVSRVLYYGLTTALGARTLGEEYVNLYYTSGNKQKFPNKVKRLLLVFFYTVLPLAGSKLISRLRSLLSSSGTPTTKIGKIKKSICKILDYFTTTAFFDLQNLHLALFYLNGKFYDFSKRVMGMSYVLSYIPQPGRESQGYEFLGGLILLQLIIKYVTVINSVLNTESDDSDNEEIFYKQLKRGHITIPPISSTSEALSEKYLVDLSDPNVLTYIPTASRSCMLCLDAMKDPACGPCGHLFCWACALEWCNEKGECPLCRTELKASQLLPIR